MSNQHTPAPWEVKDQWGYIKVHSADNGVCVIHGLDFKAQANARLIAAAPELLAALQKIDENAAESVEWIRRVVRDAIDTATSQK